MADSRRPLRLVAATHYILPAMYYYASMQYCKLSIHLACAVFTATVNNVSLLANRVCVANMRHLNLGFHLSHIMTTSGTGPDRIGTVQIVKVTGPGRSIFWLDRSISIDLLSPLLASRQGAVYSAAQLLMSIRVCVCVCSTTSVDLCCSSALFYLVFP